MDGKADLSLSAMNLAPFGQTWEILDTDFYFTNAAAFMKWKYCLNNAQLFKQYKPNT